MKIKKAFKSVPWGYLLIALLLAAAGVLLLSFPEESVSSAVWVIGILTVLIFTVRAVIDVSAFVNREKSAKRALLVLGDALALVCGGFFIFAPGMVLPYLFSALGLYLIIDGAFKLQTTVNLHHYKMVSTWFVLPFAVVCIALGFALIKFPDSSECNSAEAQPYIILLGIALLADACAQLLSMFTLPAINARRKKETLAEAAEEEALEKERAHAKQEKQDKKRKHKKADAPAEEEAPEAAIPSSGEPQASEETANETADASDTADTGEAASANEGEASDTAEPIQ